MASDFYTYHKQAKDRRRRRYVGVLLFLLALLLAMAGGVLWWCGGGQPAFFHAGHGAAGTVPYRRGQRLVGKDRERL